MCGRENLVLCCKCWPLGLPCLPEIWVSKSFVRIILAQASKEQRYKGASECQSSGKVQTLARTWQ